MSMSGSTAPDSPIHAYEPLRPTSMGRSTNSGAPAPASRNVAHCGCNIYFPFNYRFINYSLIEPASIPRINLFCANMKTIMIGKATKIPARAISGLKIGSEVAPTPGLIAGVE